MFGEGGGVLPVGLERMEPSPALAAFLSTLSDETLSGFDRVRVLRAYQRLASYIQAQVFEAMASIANLIDQLDADPEIAHEAAAAEIGAALRLTRRAAESDLGLALDLKERLPEVWEALAAGKIDLRRARVIVNETSHLSEEAAREVVGRVLEAATRLTTGQLRALIRKVCVQADPDDAESRYQEAVDGRRIEMEPSVDGTANMFGLDLPPDRAAAAMRRINDLARGLKTWDETRTLDQIRADVFLDLLDGRQFARGGKRGTVDIHVDLTTLSRLSDDPGELAGACPPASGGTAPPRPHLHHQRPPTLRVSAFLTTHGRSGDQIYVAELGTFVGCTHLQQPDSLGSMPAIMNHPFSRV